MEEMENRLKEIFSYVNGWLSHAEAKNGAIIVLNGASVVGIMAIILGKDYNIEKWLRIHFIIVIVLLLISTAISLLSFMPMTSKLESYGDSNDQDLILIFFGDIAKFKNSRQYVLRMYKEYNNITKTEADISKLEDDYAKEIIYNSKITMRKYKYFKIALFFTISAFVSLPVVVLVGMIIKIYNKLNQI